MTTLKNTFETDRLIIRPTTEVDADLILELFNTPKWLANIGDRNVHNIEDAAAYIKNKMLPQFEKLGFGNNTVILKESNAKIGTCGLYDREGLEGIDIGFAFLPQYEKMGYGFEAAIVLRDAAFQLYGYTHIGAITTKSNVESQSLLIKLGLTFKETVNLPNDDEELLYYILKKFSFII